MNELPVCVLGLKMLFWIYSKLMHSDSIFIYSGWNCYLTTDNINALIGISLGLRMLNAISVVCYTWLHDKHSRAERSRASETNKGNFIRSCSWLFIDALHFVAFFRFQTITKKHIIPSFSMRTEGIGHVFSGDSWKSAYLQPRSPAHCSGANALNWPLREKRKMLTQAGRPQEETEKVRA